MYDIRIHPRIPNRPSCVGNSNNYLRTSACARKSLLGELLIPPTHDLRVVLQRGYPAYTTILCYFFLTACSPAHGDRKLRAYDPRLPKLRRHGDTTARYPPSPYCSGRDWRSFDLQVCRQVQWVGEVISCLQAYDHFLHIRTKAQNNTTPRFPPSRKTYTPISK